MRERMKKWVVWDTIVFGYVSLHFPIGYHRSHVDDHRVEQPWTEYLPEMNTSVYETIKPDLLHQLVKGIFLDLLLPMVIHDLTSRDGQNSRTRTEKEKSWRNR